jgi:hypothetical protein
MCVWRKVKETINLVLNQDPVAEVSARYDVFAIFKAGKKSNTILSTFDLDLMLTMHFENCSLGIKCHLLAEVCLLWKFQVGQTSHYRDSSKVGWKHHLYTGSSTHRDCSFVLWCRVVGAHLHFVRYTLKRPSLDFRSATVALVVIV